MVLGAQDIKMTSAASWVIGNSERSGETFASSFLTTVCATEGAILTQEIKLGVQFGEKVYIGRTLEGLKARSLDKAK